MVKFRTRFWELLSEKEQRENSRYNNISEMSDEIGVTRATLYKYANEELASVDAGTISALMNFLGIEESKLERILLIGDNPQLNAQEGSADVLKTAV